MAVNTVQHFRAAPYVTGGRYDVTNSAGDIFASDATYTRDLTRLTVMNNNASSRTLTIYDSDGTNHDIVMILTIAGNTGIAEATPAKRLLSENYLPGVVKDPAGNYFFRLAPGRKLRAVASATSSLVILYTIESYQGS